MFDRRFYQRVGVGMRCVVFNNKTGVEWQGKLYDISESGIRLCLDKGSDISCLRVGNLIAFQGVDSYSYLESMQNRKVVVQGVAKIIRLDIDNFEMGAELIEPSSSLLQEYIAERKVVGWLHDDFIITSV